MKLNENFGISSVLIEKLESSGIETVDDLLTYYPRRYIDRTKQLDISELIPGEEATFYGIVEAVSQRRTKNRKSMVEAIVADGSARIKVTFFNQAWRAKQLKVDTQAAFFGKVKEYRGNFQLVNPLVDIIREGKESLRTGVIVPIYPQSAKENLSTHDVNESIQKVLQVVDDLDEILEPKYLDKLKLVSRSDAFRFIHAPLDSDQARQGARRLRFDEFLYLQMIMVSKYLSNENKKNSISLKDDSLEKQFLKSLPFDLTGSQENAIKEIDEDLSGNNPMHRLLQGDVGSGKTVVAFAAALRAAGSGAQTIFLAPTEVLANQHYQSAIKMFEGINKDDDTNLFGQRNVNVQLLTGSTSSEIRSRIEKGLESGEVDVLISTHAVLYQDYKYKNLGMIVVDEQHRFGVDQRSALLENQKSTPHLLVMSATPIPRTAAMLFFGDLKNTVMRDSPKNRKPISTKIARTRKQKESAYKKVRSEVEKGRQAYVVCALVNESDKIEARSAVEHIDQLRENELKGFEIGLIHGQMPVKEKEEVMELFKAGKIQVLVSTTVIEVGIDVSNATVMVVEDADRFGLSQLHQLRGRVGRGSDESFCFLLSEKDSQTVQDRLGAMEKTTDGFELAEIDLELRGAGHILGGVQSGIGDLKLGRLPRDAKYVEFARKVAMEKLTADPNMESDFNAVLAKEIAVTLENTDIDYVFKS